MPGIGWTVLDAYCGLGGFSAGALQALEAAGETATFIGIDSDKAPLEVWKRNVSKSTAATETTSVCKMIGKDVIDWPEEDERLIIHWSPCCQPFSKARAVPAAASAVDGGLEQIRLILELVLQKGYRRWSVEEVAHPQIVALVKEYTVNYPQHVAFDTLDAVSYGCPSERRRLIITSPALLKELKGRTTTEYLSPKSALVKAGMVPASDFYRTGSHSSS